MMYCPICNEELQPGKVCTCGWDPSCDYENYLSLVPAPSGLPTVVVQRKAFWNQRLEDQKKADEARFEQLKQTFEARFEALESQQKINEDRINALTRQIMVLQSENTHTLAAVPVLNDSASEAPRTAVNSTSVVLSPAVVEALMKVKIGEEISFGKYWQSASKSAGKTELKWRILAKEGSRALVISQYGLDAKPYNKEDNEITWADCSLRKWLNGEFYREAFAEEDQNIILSKEVPADKNPKYDADPGKPTTDKVFLLSISEVNRYFGSDEDRVCIPTAYAKEEGAFASRDGKTWWWVRSPGNGQVRAAGVDAIGSVNCAGASVYHNFVNCVRPAMWINLASYLVTEAAVNTEETAKPVEIKEKENLKLTGDPVHTSVMSVDAVTASTESITSFLEKLIRYSHNNRNSGCTSELQNKSGQHHNG